MPSGPRLFISHSSEEDDLAKRAVRELLKRVDGNIQILFDEKVIDTGDHWRDTLWEWWADCDAAVVICSKAALASRWVFIEVTMLMRRHALTPLPIFPILIHPVEVKDLKTGALFRDQQFAELQATRRWKAANVEAEADALAAKINKLTVLSPLKKPLFNWEERIAIILQQNVPAELLAKAAVQLGDDRRGAIAIERGGGQSLLQLGAGVADVVQIQEKVTALSLRDTPAARAEIDKLLQPIVRTLYESDHSGLARWAARAFAQFRSSTQTMPAAWSMMRAASVRLSGGSGTPATSPAVGWQAIESSIRSLPRVPIYITLHRDAISVGTAPVDDAARIEIPSTEPLLLDVAWQGGSRRIAFSAGQSVDMPLDPHELTVTTILGESHEIRTAMQLDDWAIAIGVGDEKNIGDDFTRFVAWLHLPTGGALPAEQCFYANTKPGWLETVGTLNSLVERFLAAKHGPLRRLYVYLYGVRGIRGPFLAADPVRQTLNVAASEFREVVVFAEVFDPPTQIDIPVLGNTCTLGIGVIERLGMLPSFTTLIIRGLEGEAADKEPVITPTELSRYVNSSLNHTPAWSFTDSGYQPLVEANDFFSFVRFENARSSEVLETRVLDDHALQVTEFSLRGPLTRRLLRGRYLLDVPELSLLQRFDVPDSEAFAVVTVEPWRARDQFIIVAGSSAEQIPVSVRLLADALGRRLAGSGFSLIVGDWIGVDEICLEAYVRTLTSLKIASQPHVRQFTRSKRLRGDGSSTIIRVKSENDEYDEPLGDTEALIALGGLGGTYEYGTRARRIGVPVVPVASTGGDAAKLYAERMLPSADWLEEPVESERDADWMACRVVALLIDTLPPKANPSNTSA